MSPVANTGREIALHLSPEARGSLSQQSGTEPASALPRVGGVSSYERSARSRAKSAPQKVKSAKGSEDLPPLTSQRSRAKSSNAASSERELSSLEAAHSDSAANTPEDFKEERLWKIITRQSRLQVDVTEAPTRALGKADINVEFRPEDNRHLIVHECSLDTQAGDSLNLQTIRDFITHRTDPSCSHSERLHAVWICVPASGAIAGRLGDGMEDIWGLRNYSRGPSARSSGQGAKQRVGAVPLAWSAALRVNHDIIIQTSIDRYHVRINLWFSPDFADQTLKNCVNIIHLDIVEIWNLNDKRRYFSSDIFKAKMSHLVKDLAGSATGNTTSDPTRAGDDYADWVNDVYRGRIAAGDMSPNYAQQVFERHARSRHRDTINRDIRSFIAEAFAIRSFAPQKDLVLIDLIKQFCVPPSGNS
ncbi:hypothetical protein EDB85DRAFT_1897119 [Lactarius pseudohatsudake]|nr:hypothetical protein EDB85DRAFT_1897119 [Lactarius pseudohatsudake]